jgi:plasmid replication initiation protein
LLLHNNREEKEGARHVTNLGADDSLVRAESNLEEYPLFAVKTRNRKEDQLVFERRRQGENEAELVQRWEVEPPAKLGMPGPFDQDVYLAVLQLLEVRGGMPRDGVLHFSLYEIRDILGWTASGNTYEKIRQSLRRISSTTLTSENAFYNKAEERFLSDTFQIWSVHFSRTRRGKNVRERHTLRFHPIFIRNYITQYLKGLDAEFYWSLPSPLAKRLYRLVDHQRDGGLSWKTDLFALRQQIPLSNYSYPSEIKRALEPAHEELGERGFLSGIEYEGKTGVLYQVSREFARRQKARELAGDPGELFAIERLVSEGLRGDVARDLVARHGSEHCLRYADALDSQRGVRNRAGWLRKAIEKAFELPEPLPLGLLPDPTERSRIEDSGAETQDRRPAPPDPDPAAQELWEQVLQDAEGDIDVSSLRVWFDGISAIGLEDSTLTVAVPNSFAKEYIETRFGELLESSLKERLSKKASLRVVVGAQPER